MATNKKCAHQLCTCQARDNDNYCSDACRDASGVTDIECNCGHPGCGGKA